MLKIIRILSALFCGVFITSGCGAVEQLTHQIDEQATARAPWKRGENIIEKFADPKGNKYFETRFLGITTQGYYLAQKFYPDGRKRSDPYLSVCPDEMAYKDRLWEGCRITGPFVVWSPDGKKEQEENYQDGKKQGI